MQAIGSVAKTAVVGDVLLALNSSRVEAKDKVLQKNIHLQGYGHLVGHILDIGPHTTRLVARLTFSVNLVGRLLRGLISPMSRAKGTARSADIRTGFELDGTV